MKRSHQRLKRLARRRTLLELVQGGGASLDEAAAVLNISKDLVMRELAVVERLEDQNLKAMVRRMRQVNHERIEELLGVFMPKALRGNEKAAKFVLSALNRQSRLLGLDAPEQKEVNHTGAVDLGLETLSAEQRAQLKAQLLSVVQVGEETDVQDVEVLQLTEGEAQ